LADELSNFGYFRGVPFREVSDLLTNFFPSCLLNETVFSLSWSSAVSLSHCLLFRGVANFMVRSSSGSQPGDPLFSESSLTGDLPTRGEVEWVFIVL